MTQLELEVGRTIIAICAPLFMYGLYHIYYGEKHETIHYY